MRMSEYILRDALKVQRYLTTDYLRFPYILGITILVWGRYLIVIGARTFRDADITWV